MPIKTPDSPKNTREFLAEFKAKTGAKVEKLVRMNTNLIQQQQETQRDLEALLRVASEVLDTAEPVTGSLLANGAEYIMPVFSYNGLVAIVNTVNKRHG